MFFGAKKQETVEEGKPMAYSEQVRQEMGLPSESDAPWIQAQRHHDNLVARKDVQILNWQRAFGCAIALAIVCSASLAYVAAQPRVEPVFIGVDKLGRTQTMATGVNAATVPLSDLVNREMVDFISNVRTVTSDYTQNNIALTKAFSRLEGAAYNYVKSDLQSHKPNEVAEKKSIQVEVKLAFPITDGNQRNSWQVEWTETSYNLKGEKMGEPEMWKANIQYERRRGQTKEEIDENPVGFHIPSLTWAKMT